MPEQLSASAGAALDVLPRIGPAADIRTFRIAGPDYEVALLNTKLVPRSLRNAPNARLTFRTLSRHQSFRELHDGDIDLVIGPGSSGSGDTKAIELFKERYCRVSGASHPSMGGDFTLKDYLRAEHIVVSPGGGVTDMADEILAGMGKRRRVVATVPNYFNALLLAAATSATVTMPAMLALSVAAQLKLRIDEPPFAMPPFAISATWLSRRSTDSGLQWLIASACEAVRL